MQSINPKTTAKTTKHKLTKHKANHRAKIGLRKLFHNPKEDRKKKTIKREQRDKQKTKNKVTDLNQTLLMMTLNANGFNISIKRGRLSDWIKKQYLTVCYP